MCGKKCCKKCSEKCGTKCGTKFENVTCNDAIVEVLRVIAQSVVYLECVLRGGVDLDAHTFCRKARDVEADRHLAANVLHKVASAASARRHFRNALAQTRWIARRHTERRRKLQFLKTNQREADDLFLSDIYSLQEDIEHTWRQHQDS